MESDRNDYTIKLSILTRAWTTLNVQPVLDMFAADHNHRLPNFWSWGASPFALAQDAFQQPWGSSTMYANPPWPLIPRVLTEAKVDHAHLVLCLPVWKGASWWPTAMALRVSKLLVLPDTLYLDHWGSTLPPLPWKTCMVVIQG